MPNLNQRIIELLKKKSSEHGFFSKLETETGINAVRWRNVARGKQVAMHDMIEAVFKLWPEEIFWIATGSKPFYTNDPDMLLGHVRKTAEHCFSNFQQSEKIMTEGKFGEMVEEKVRRAWHHDVEAVGRVLAVLEGKSLNDRMPQIGNTKEEEDYLWEQFHRYALWNETGTGQKHSPLGRALVEGIAKGKTL